MSETMTYPPPSGGQAKQWAVPASYAQERVWFASQVARGVPVYHVVDEIYLPYPLPADQIRAALTRLCDRHETLRTSFRIDDGRLMQVVHAEIDLPVTEIDLTARPGSAQQDEITATLDELAYAEIPLDRPPLWRATLARLADSRWALLFVAHHAVVDAESMYSLRAELDEFCAAEHERRPAELVELPIQYADYAVWQRNRLSGGRMEELLSFWRRTLDGAPHVHSLRTDRPRPADRSFAGADIVFPLPERATARATELGRRSGATPFMVLFAAYAALLHRLSGSGDVVIGLPVAGRDHPDLRPLIGMFVNVIVIRVDVSGDPSFAELLGRVRVALLDAWDHQEMPFQKLVEALASQRQPGVPPLYQIGLNYISIGFSRRSATTEDDVALEIVNDQARLEYNTALFDESTARRITGGYQRVLADVLARPTITMSELRVDPETGGAETGGAETGGAETGGAEIGTAETGTARRAYVAPRTAAEELVAAVWAEVLGVGPVGAHDEFFELGGHSLLALRVIARLSAAAEIDLTIQGFFADTTVAGVAADVERVLAAELDELPEDEAERLAASEGQPR
jgi:hypothetical protein